jgi:hypothetical protein
MDEINYDQKRFIAKAFPFSPFEEGEVLPVDENGMIYYPFTESNEFINPKEYPHIFTELDWWEKRPNKDLPTYLRNRINRRVIKVHRYDIDNDKIFVGDGSIEWKASTCLSMGKPSTENAYENFAKSFKK